MLPGFLEGDVELREARFLSISPIFIYLLGGKRSVISLAEALLVFPSFFSAMFSLGDQRKSSEF